MTAQEDYSTFIINPKEKYSQQAKEVPWSARSIPETFATVQENNNIPVRCIDWWSTRSLLCCCIFPCIDCYTGATLIDSTDPSVWKKQLDRQNGPESMRGVWWLKYNNAAENLVTIFNDAEFIGDYNEEGSEGFGRWERSLAVNWSRDNALFGQFLTVYAKTKKDPTLGGYYNLKEGILTLEPYNQWIFRVDENQWWKIHYGGAIGEEGEQDVNYMYKWLKVLDKDGNPTEHWEDYVSWAKAPLPNRNCCEPCITTWGCCLSNKQIFENMITPNPKQLVMFRE